jgi:uncharacterized peroxidase-related enzyme
VTHHRRGLRRLLRDDDLLARIEADFEAAGLSAKRLAMLRYARTLTCHPADVTQADIEGLRRVGFADADVLAIAEVVAYYAYVNRLADGLGVQLEAGTLPVCAPGKKKPGDAPQMG